MSLKIPLDNILFLDIETVPQYPNFDEVPENWKALWEKKSRQFKVEDTAKELYGRAGIYAEFGKIVVITAGFFYTMAGKFFLKLKSYKNHNEKTLLADFNDMLVKYGKQKDFLLCAHNGKEFDFPYIARRTLLNGLSLPPILDIAGRKPWEINHLDTMELWKFGDYKHYTSLELLATAFGIPTPKDDIDGSQVHIVYYEENDLDRIARYCEKDVLTIARLYQKYSGLPLIKDEDVVVE